MKKQIQLLSVISLLFWSACNNNSGEKKVEEQTQETMKFSSTEKAFGTYDGEVITKYTLANPSGMEVSIINYGGTVTDIITPDKNGAPGNVVLGYDSLSGYLQKRNPYFG